MIELLLFLVGFAGGVTGVALGAYYLRRGRAVADAEAKRRETTQIIVRAFEPPVVPVGQISPLMVQTETLKQQLMKLYTEGMAQGYFLEVTMRPFGSDHIDKLRIPVVQFQWRTASMGNVAGANAMVAVNPETPGK